MDRKVLELKRSCGLVSDLEYETWLDIINREDDNENLDLLESVFSGIEILNSNN